MVEVPTILVLGLIVTIVVLLYWKDAINSKLTIADARANEHKTQADANVRLLGQAMSKLSKPALNSDNEISKLKGLVDDLRHSAVDLDKTYQQDLYRKQQHIVRLTNELSVYKNPSSKPGLRTPKNLESETERLRAKVEKSQSFSDLPHIDNQQDKNPNPKYVQSTQPKLTKEQMWAKRHADDKKRHKEQKRQQELLWLEAERVKESNKEQKLLLKETRVKKTRLEIKQLNDPMYVMEREVKKLEVKTEQLADVTKVKSPLPSKTIHPSNESSPADLLKMLSSPFKEHAPSDNSYGYIPFKQIHFTNDHLPPTQLSAVDQTANKNRALRKEQTQANKHDEQLKRPKGFTPAPIKPVTGSRLSTPRLSGTCEACYAPIYSCRC